MAEKSKRATTSVPRKRDQQATSKATKKASKPTTATKTATTAKKSVENVETKVKGTSTSATAKKKVSKKTAPAEAKPKASTKKAAKAAETTAAPVAAPAPDAPVAEAAPVEQVVEVTPAANAPEAPAPEVTETVAKPVAEPEVEQVEAPPPPPAPERKSKATRAEERAAAAEAKKEAIAPPVETPSAVAKKKKPSKKLEKKKTTKEGSATRSSPPLLKHYQFIGVPSFKGQVFEPKRAPVVAPPPVPKQLTLEERLESLQVRFGQLSEATRKQIQDQLDMSWIYHDSALEGVVYSFQELKTALGPDQTVVQESNLQPVVDEIRRHRAAIELVRECAKKRSPITVDLVKKIYLTLHPEEGDLKTLKYRKDIPQHRLYFHEYAPPDKIAAKVRQVIDWVNEPESQKGRNALRIAARAHYDLLRTFPFTHDSGKVARLLMNLLLLQAGYEPAIIHSTERQRYYDALKGSAPTIITMVIEAEENAVMSLEKLLDERDSRSRSFTG